ncbi:lysozyme inhibitor LprI family protein [Pseudomonas mosselii]|uniref:lysozyme inhibitor LprI family protein n=1 Tax=Pseudomonas mosselii TaxID=78327 RepID=UPI003F383C18
MKSMAWLVLLAVAGSTHAAEEESTPCDNVETEQQGYACAAYNKQTAERELKAAYDDLMQRIRDQYADESDKAAALSGKMEAAEKLWAQLRDADCKVETWAEKPGSKAYEAAWDTCVAQHSDERSEYLQSIGQQ